MPDIVHDFPINASPERVFRAVSEPAGLDAWWTRTSAGKAVQGGEYALGFGPEYDWRATVTRCVPGREFELQISRSNPDWDGTRVGFVLAPEGKNTSVQFHHLGWPEANAHYRISCYCWAMYLRVLKRHLEFGENVPYEKRLDV